MTDELSRDPDSWYMRRALALAERGWGRVSPNPLVGAVLVRDGSIVGEGWHREFGEAHAEVEALRVAGDAARGATIYVTLEPCSHRGKTGPCTEALLAAGVRRVVFACEDPNPVAGGGGDLLAEAGVEVLSGVEIRAARALNPAFLRAADPDAPARPWLELKLAVSLDHRMADASGNSAWVTGEESREEVHRLRAAHDAIAVGIGTVLADDPRLTVRGPIVPRKPPVRIVFDRRLRLPLSSRLLRGIEEAPVWVVTATDAPAREIDSRRAAGAEILQAPDLHTSLERLRERGITSIFCEGGAELAGAMLRAELVDRLTLIQAPFFLGEGGADPFRGIESHPLADAHRWSPVRRMAVGEDTLISLDR